MRLNTYQIRECIPLSLAVAPAALRVCGQGMSSVPNEGGTMGPCHNVHRYAPCGVGYVGCGPQKGSRVGHGHGQTMVVETHGNISA